MTLFSTGQKPTKVFRLSDNVGSDSVKIENAHGFVVAEFDSEGNLKHKGKVIKK